MSKKLLFFSSNEMWSGSEELWYGSALNFLNKGDNVSIVVKYNHPNLDRVRDKLTLFVEPDRFSGIPSFPKRVLNRIRRKYFKEVTTSDKIISFDPDLVIISQGNNISSADIMELCVKNNYPFITITQLVAEVHLLFINDSHFLKLRVLYNKALKNFFVSNANLLLHNSWFGSNSSNNEVIYNPFKVKQFRRPAYPDTKVRYQFAYVGRLECFHKGLDMLVQIISSETWKQRPVVFNFYGIGPHENLLKEVLSGKGVSNVNFCGFSADVINVWENNHILLLPSRMEGQALALIEAVNCGRTAIVTDVGGASEILENNISGFIAKSATIADLEDAMERAWEQRDNWEKMGQLTYNRIKNVYPEDAVKYFCNKIDGLM